MICSQLSQLSLILTLVAGILSIKYKAAPSSAFRAIVSQSEGLLLTAAFSSPVYFQYSSYKAGRMLWQSIKKSMIITKMTHNQIANIMTPDNFVIIHK